MLDAARQAGRIRLEIYPMAFIDAGSTAAANAFGCAAEAGFAPGYYAGLFGNPILRWSDDQLLALPAAVGATSTPAFAACVTGRTHAGWVDSINRGRRAARGHRHADRAGRRRGRRPDEVDARRPRDNDQPLMPTLLSIPSPSRAVWEIGGFPLRAYALCIIVGILVGMVIATRRWRARGGSSESLELVVAVAVPLGIIGARLYHVATDYHLYFGPGRNPVDALKIWQGGLGVWGAIAFGALGAWLVARRRQIRFPALLDAIAPGILVAQAIGRLGNWFNQELFGRPTTLPWALEIAPQYRPAGFEQFGTFHPTFLYELLWNLCRSRRAGLVGPAVPARPRQGVRALCDALHRGSILDRGAADRHRDRDRGLPSEQLHLADTLPGCAGLADLAGPQPPGAGGGRRGARADRMPPRRPRPHRRSRSPAEPASARARPDRAGNRTTGDPMKRIRLFHFDIKTYGNYGDTLLFEAVKQSFNGFAGGEAFEIYDSRPLRDPVGPALVNYINDNVDAVVVGGGGLFLRDTNPNQRSGWQWNISVDQLKRLKKPLILFSVGNNRFIDQADFAPPFSEHVNLTMEKSVFFGLRNTGSVETIKPYIAEANRDRVEYQPCPTTISSYLFPDLVKAEVDPARRLGLEMIVGKRQRAAGFVAESIYRDVITAVKRLQDEGWQIDSVPHARADMHFVEQAAREHLRMREIKLFGDRDGLYKGVEYFADLPYFLGTRGHAQMVPFGMGAIPISLLVHHKTGYFAQDLGHPDWAVDPRQDGLRRPALRRAARGRGAPDRAADRAGRGAGAVLSRHPGQPGGDLRAAHRRDGGSGAHALHAVRAAAGRAGVRGLAGPRQRGRAGP